MNKLLEKLWRMLPDRCVNRRQGYRFLIGGKCPRKGVRGNENWVRIGTTELSEKILLCDDCSAALRRGSDSVRPA